VRRKLPRTPFWITSGLPTIRPEPISASHGQCLYRTFQLEIDDVLVAYTDGITEVENRDGELWGERGLKKLLASCSHHSPDQIIKCILDEVSTFADRLPQRDDMTLVVMQVQPGCSI